MDVSQLMALESVRLHHNTKHASFLHTYHERKLTQAFGRYCLIEYLYLGGLRYLAISVNPLLWAAIPSCEISPGQGMAAVAQGRKLRTLMARGIKGPAITRKSQRRIR